MTEQLKAEAYVRKQRPALMELTFGCEIWPNSHGGDIFTTSLWNLVAVDDRSLILRPKGECVDEDIQTVDIKYCKIIGHPIALHHWLSVLVESNNHWDYKLVIRGDGVCFYKQKELLTFNLTTGQPNSPQDYANFNQIVNN
jgi:hypothetical protein